MYTGLLHLHSTLPYLLILLLIITAGKSIMGASSGAEYTKGDDKLSLFTLILAHTQFLVGMILYFQSPMVNQALSDMGAAMKHPKLRLYAVEHPTVMLLSVILITIGRSRSKKQTGAKKHKTVAIFFTIATVLILSRIPWSTWL